MGVSYFNPYRQKAMQYQQRNQQQQGQPQQFAKQGRQQPRTTVKNSFDPEWLDKDVEIERVKGQVVEEIRARVIDISKYWLKLFVNNKILYLNKAYILSIKPVEIESGALGGNNAGGK
jgi:hypothetical protein